MATNRNPWHQLFIDGDRMDHATESQIKAGMRCMAMAYKVRHGDVTADFARTTLRVQRPYCHPRLHATIDRCMVEEPDKVVDTANQRLG